MLRAWVTWATKVNAVLTTPARGTVHSSRPRADTPEGPPPDCLFRRGPGHGTAGPERNDQAIGKAFLNP
ncbi:hypothetical protein Sm713_47910 [Streptomyces sp. TS71-3]|nr:hypothetical protein Sm713_47910 [Streptomyces sp. TS71-3]